MMSLAKKNLTVPILGYGTCKELGNILYVPVVEYDNLMIRVLRFVSHKDMPGLLTERLSESF